MKLKVITPYFYPAHTYGGPITASYNLSKEIAKIGVEVSVISTDANGSERLDVIANKFHSKDGFQIKYYFEQIRSYLSFKMIASLYADISKSDIVHIQAIYSYPTPLALFYSFVQKKKVLLSPRGSLSEWSFLKNGFAKNIWIKILIKPFVKKIHWHATSEKEKYEILMFFPEASVQLISDGVEKIVVVDEDDRWKGEPYIASLGRVHAVKGYDIVIDSMQEILKIYPQLKFKIAGEDYGELANLINKTMDLGLDKSIQFVGNLSGNDKLQFLKNAKCLLMPSHTENFGIVAVESLSCQTPVIASKNTPWQSLEVNGAGLFVENTSEEFTKAVIKILENENQFKKNTLILANQFRWDIIAKKYKDILSEIIEE